MFTQSKPDQPWSQIGLKILIGAVVATALLSIAEGVVRGPLETLYLGDSPFGRANYLMIGLWVADFRYLTEQLVLAGSIIFAGARFIEARTVFTIGFDKQDTSKISLKGPDADNIVWIGHRYGTQMEAETVAEAFAERLKESAA
jgi:hypothetical protein